MDLMRRLNNKNRKDVSILRLHVIYNEQLGQMEREMNISVKIVERGWWETSTEGQNWDDKIRDIKVRKIEQYTEKDKEKREQKEK